MEKKEQLKVTALSMAIQTVQVFLENGVKDQGTLSILEIAEKYYKFLNNN